MSAAEMREAAAQVWDAVANLAARGTPPEGILAIAKGNAVALRAPLPDEKGMVERAARAIAENEHACSIDGLEACRSRSNCQCYENARAAILAINGGNL